jgi:HK97 family phage prohead protease
MSRGLEFKTLRLAELKASQGGAEFEGLASAFYCIDDSWWNDIVAPGAFREDLPEFLERGFVGGTNHNWDEPIGRPLHAEERPEGLFVRASVSETAHGRDVRTLLKDGVIRFLSIGFRALVRTHLETAEEVQAWWRSVGYTPTAEDVAKSQHGARLLTRIKLFEVSPVAVPANPHAAITAVHGQQPGAAAGRSLAEHSETVLATVEEWVERLRSLHGLRRLEGRGLSPDHQAGLRQVAAQLREWTESPEARKPTGAGTREAERLRDEYERIAARGSAG